ncbi:glycoprotein [Balamuthia mandrillaris]
MGNNWLLEYDTYKTVRISDSKLGALYYSCVLFIFVYTVLYTVIYNKAYFEYETPVGAVAISLLPSTKTREAAVPDYCLPTGEAAERSDNHAVRLPCQLWDESEVVSPYASGGANSFFLTTRVEEYVEQRLCPRDSLSCSHDLLWKPLSTSTFFVADIEQFTIRVQHSMQAPQFFEESQHNGDYAKDNRGMAGVVLTGHGPNRRILKRFPVNESFDDFDLHDLLQAADEMDLDSPIMEASGEVTSLRTRGVILHVDLAYNNIRCDGKLSCAFGKSPLSYRYRIYHVPEAEKELIETHPLNDTHRLRRVRHGILMDFHQTGKIGRFSMQVLLIHLCSGLGMMTLATVFVDFLAVYMLPSKSFYAAKKFHFCSAKEMKQVTDKTEKGGKEHPKKQDDGSSSPAALPSSQPSLRKRKPKKNKIHDNAE